MQLSVLLSFASFCCKFAAQPCSNNFIQTFEPSLLFHPPKPTQTSTHHQGVILTHKREAFNVKKPDYKPRFIQQDFPTGFWVCRGSFINTHRTMKNKAIESKINQNS